MHQTALAYWHIDKFKNYSLCIYVSKPSGGCHRYRKCVAPYPERGSLDYGRDSKAESLDRIRRITVECG